MRIASFPRTPSAHSSNLAALVAIAVLGFMACSSGDKTPSDSAAPTDAAVDLDGTAATEDSGVADATANPTDADTDAAADVAAQDAGAADAAPLDTATADGGAADAVAADGTPTDGSTTDSSTTDSSGDTNIAIDTTLSKVCNSGETKCFGAKLATCGVYEDGWIQTNCFPGTTCSGGKCLPVSNNLIIAFDTSGSMGGTVKGCTATGQSWPTCDPTKKCTRMDVSKVVFTAALKKIDANATRMALFRFPQKLYKKNSGNCTSGFYQGAGTISGEQSPGPSNKQEVTATSAWYWQTLNQTLSVRFPPDGLFKSKEKILAWMDGTEAIKSTGASCSNSSSYCKAVAGCAGACCSGACWVHTDPELRQAGGTPIGKTLFYIGEYLKNVVVIDGKACKTTTDCDNVNYVCKMAKPGDTTGHCKDIARTCRETIVVLFTDGGQSNSNSFFAPWVQAKRFGFGLCCQSAADCVGGSADNPTVCKAGNCLPKTAITGYFCSADMKPCLPNSAKGDATYCSKQCTADPLPKLTVCASDPKNNVLRSPDGKPFGVKLNVVDISGLSNLKNSMNIAIAGNGKLLGIDASDPDVFLKALTAVFDIKNKKVCNESF